MHPQIADASVCTTSLNHPRIRSFSGLIAPVAAAPLEHASKCKASSLHRNPRQFRKTNYPIAAKNPRPQRRPGQSETGRQSKPDKMRSSRTQEVPAGIGFAGNNGGNSGTHLLLLVFDGFGASINCDAYLHCGAESGGKNGATPCQGASFCFARRFLW